MEWSLTGLPLPIVLRPPSPFSDDDLLLFSSRNGNLRIEKNSEGDIVIMTPLGGEGGIWEATVIRELRILGRGRRHRCYLLVECRFQPCGRFHTEPRRKLGFPQPVGMHSSAEDRRKISAAVPGVSGRDTCRDRLEVCECCKAKMEAWIANGAQLAWMIDPYAATLTIYRCKPRA